MNQATTHPRSGNPKRTGLSSSEAERTNDASRRILLVDDDLDTLELISFNLIEEGFQVNIALEASEALYKVQRVTPDLIVLDVMLPGLDGFKICEQLRSTPLTRETPVIFLTARSSEADRVRGFELGANDYVTKPFSPRELLLRVRNLLPARVQAQSVFQLGDLRIDRAAHVVTVAGEPVSLTITEFRLLSILAQQNGRVQTREHLLAEVWKGEAEIDPRTVDTHMTRLREKLGKAAGLVATVYGVGYRFVTH